MTEQHRPQNEQEQADAYDETTVMISPVTLQQPRQTSAAARSSSDEGQETQSGSTEAASASKSRATTGGINTAAACQQEPVPAAAAGSPAAANEQFQSGQALLDDLTAFYKAQGEQAPHIIKCATVSIQQIHDLPKRCNAVRKCLAPGGDMPARTRGKTEHQAHPFQSTFVGAPRSRNSP